MILIFIDNEKDFYELTNRFNLNEGYSDSVQYPTEYAAHTMSFSLSGLGHAVFVTLGNTKNRSDQNIACVMAHEATHVKQFCLEYIGEENVGAETEAYMVEYFLQYLLSEIEWRKNNKRILAKKARILKAKNEQHKRVCNK